MELLIKAVGNDRITDLVSSSLDDVDQIDLLSEFKFFQLLAQTGADSFSTDTTFDFRLAKFFYESLKEVYFLDFGNNEPIDYTDHLSVAFKEMLQHQQVDKELIYTTILSLMTELADGDVTFADSKVLELMHIDPEIQPFVPSNILFQMQMLLENVNPSQFKSILFNFSLKDAGLDMSRSVDL